MANGQWSVRPMSGKKQYALVNSTGSDAFDVELSGAVIVGTSEEELRRVSPDEAVEFHDSKTMGNSDSPVVTWADEPSGTDRHQFRVSI